MFLREFCGCGAGFCRCGAGKFIICAGIFHYKGRSISGLNPLRDYVVRGNFGLG
jgi:hypothetical protein